MAMLILEPSFERRIIEERQALGHDAQDEVWDGIYVVNPIYDNEHQVIRGGLCLVLGHQLDLPEGTEVLPGVNVSDRDEDWGQNYRCPDVVVFMPNCQAMKRDAHSFGGPDLVIEIVTEGDRSWDKVGFYASINTRELLIIERKPWQLTLLRLQNGKLVSVGCTASDNDVELRSEVLPVSFRLLWKDGEPEIEVRDVRDGRAFPVIERRFQLPAR
jgi:hypothetical protein